MDRKMVVIINTRDRNKMDFNGARYHNNEAIEEEKFNILSEGGKVNVNMRIK